MFITISENKDKLDCNKDFYIQVDIPNVEKNNLNPGIHTTTCTNCNRTCHDNCSYANNDDKDKCVAMKNNYCTVCPNHCYWNIHYNVPYILVYTSKKEKRRAEDIYKTYQNAKSNLSKSEQTLQGLEDEYVKLAIHCIQLQENIKKCVDNLKSIALKSEIIGSSEEYLELIIQSELIEKKPGYQQRIKGFSEMKQQYKLLKDACNGNIQSSFEEIIEEANKKIKCSKYEPNNMNIVQKFMNKVKQTIYNTKC